MQPFWKKHKDSPRQHTGYDASEQSRIQSTKAKLRDKYEFVLFGEAYHGLLSFFYLHWHAGEGIEKRFKPKIYTTKGKAKSEIQHLFKWYNAPLEHQEVDYMNEDRKESLRAGYDAKKSATEIITSTFEQYRAIMEESLETNSDELASLLDQGSIFGVFRAMLDHPYGFLEDEGKSTTDLTLYLDYLRPSYSAKYWLNRYLRETQNNKKLPKKEDVTNLAVIHCRLHAARNDGRWMNDALLKHISQAIRCANHRAKYTNGARISHILLYGDFVEADGQKMRTLVEQTCQLAQYEEVFTNFTFETKQGKADLRGLKGTDDASIEVLYVSRPWLPRAHGDRKNRKEETNPSVHRLWADFREPNVDPMPLQVKILAIWTMLCKRYGPKVCVIGHRSGFVEGAAFVGIPVFYLNCERPTSHKSAGEMLYKPVKPSKWEQGEQSKKINKAKRDCTVSPTL